LQRRISLNIKMNNANIKSSVVNWIMNHDDDKAFIITYIGLAVILSIAFGLFWLCMVVGIHFTFELLRQHYTDKPLPAALRAALWEVKLDIFLVLFAFVIAVYMEVVLGAAGLSAGARATATAGARFAGWQRVIRAIALSLDDLAQIIRAAGKHISSRQKPGEESTDTGGHTDNGHMHTEDSGISRADICSLAFGAVCIILIISAPLFTDHTPAGVFTLIAEELHPFPAKD